MFLESHIGIKYIVWEERAAARQLRTPSLSRTVLQEALERKSFFFAHVERLRLLVVGS